MVMDDRELVGASLKDLSAYCEAILLTENIQGAVLFVLPEIWKPFGFPISFAPSTIKKCIRDIAEFLVNIEDFVIDGLEIQEYVPGILIRDFWYARNGKPAFTSFAPKLAEQLTFISQDSFAPLEVYVEDGQIFFAGYENFDMYVEIFAQVTTQVA